MTQPVQEPSQGRTDQGQEFRTRQLFRRPAPASAGVPQWPLSYDVLPYLRPYIGMDYDTAYGFGSSVVDATYPPAGFYTDNLSGGSFRDDASFISYFRLGPQGSAWCLNFVVETGTDCGKVETEWATLPESSPGQGYPSDGLGLPPNSSDYTFNWYKPFGGNYLVPDFYAGITSKTDTYQEWNPFRIMGTDGTALTADGADDGYFGYSEFNGGAGLWALRIRVNGKDVAATDYKTRFSMMRLSRIGSVGNWEIG